jgi:hypothetical protein
MTTSAFLIHARASVLARLVQIFRVKVRTPGGEMSLQAPLAVGTVFGPVGGVGVAAIEAPAVRAESI